MNARRRAVLIAGPTASGKSALALARARRNGGVIVNADAMQVYDVLRVVTARPSAEEEALAEHRLYGVVPPSYRFSTGQWLAAVSEVVADVGRDREVIFVGGTGLYLDSLINGFADVPEIAPEVVEAVQREVDNLAEPARMKLLESVDPPTAARLRVADPQRVVRAVAVKRATGRSLSSFQSTQQPGLLDGWSIERMVIAPDRAVLRGRIAERFANMFQSGAVDEVKALLSLGLDKNLPAMKAIGVPEIGAWLAGQLTQEDAIERAVIATRQYAKRQETWFRNRMGDWPRFHLNELQATL